ncbi:MAG: YXWGXW repeat-containing protein, partial [Gammaproteobacteria bacterium]|nr:YXWGXW repeat-containing protein [Gammaproteobacteria bacterium]
MWKRHDFGVAARGAALALAASLVGACVVQPLYPPSQPAYAPAPEDQAPADQYGGYGDGNGDGNGDAGGYADPQVYVRATIAPPPLPVYEQPPCPAEGYLWTPGYWAYGPEGYFWVPGTWVEPPRVGLLWTPGYWGWGGGVFVFHAGYWGPRVGFYGGINYGGGYVGDGFVGGRWEGERFAYNRAVTNVNVTVVHNTYNRTIINNNVTINNVTVNRVSYNGGPGGRQVAPTREQRMAARDPHIAVTPMQRAQIRAASVDRAQFVRYNRGRPPVAATPRPRAFDSPQVERARGAVVPPRQFAPPSRQQPQREFAPPS